MKRRCYNENSQRFYTHGARGISVCPRWLDYVNFHADMGEKPDGFSLERIDNDGNYEPSNCKWATPKEQAMNRRTNVWYTYEGTTLTIHEWAKRLGFSFAAMRKRFNRWSVNDAIEIARKRN